MDKKDGSAYHEAGHLLIGLLFKLKFENDFLLAEVRKDIKPVTYIEKTDFSKTNSEYYFHHLLCLFAGEIAEEIKECEIDPEGSLFDKKEVECIFNRMDTKQGKRKTEEMIAIIVKAILIDNTKLIDEMHNTLYNEGKIYVSNKEEIERKIIVTKTTWRMYQKGLCGFG
jgi:hypothetical protein